MEEKLQREKEKEAEDREKATEIRDNQDEVKEVVSGSEVKPTAAESSTEDETMLFTPGPIRVSTTTTELPTTNVQLQSELPPVPQTVVEQERLEMIEVKNDGTSGHLTHSLE